MKMELISPDVIHISKRCRSSMDNREKLIVHGVFTSPLFDAVDLQSTAQYLCENGLLDYEHIQELNKSHRQIHCERLLQSHGEMLYQRHPKDSCESDKETVYQIYSEAISKYHSQPLGTKSYTRRFIETVCDNIRLEELIQALYFTGYANIAQILFRKSLLAQNQNCLVVVKRLNTRNKQSIEIYFRFLKRVVHNGKLEEPFKWLRKLAREIKIRMERENDEEKRQYYADKYVAHLGAEIDAMAITFDKTLPDAEIFSDLKCLSNKSSKPLISDIVYFGRRANALAIAGKFDEGESMVTGAHCCANFAGPCLEIANMIYIDVYFKLWQFEHSPSQQIQKELIFAGNKGLWALSEEDEDTRNLWTRMFLLRMIFCLLGIGNKANVIKAYSVPMENVSEARKLLDAVQLEGIETRREMFYWVAKARHYHLKNEMNECRESIEKAEHLALKGHFKELVNIQNYASYIKCLSGTELTLPKEPETDLTLRSSVELSNIDEKPIEHEVEAENDFESTDCKVVERTSSDNLSNSEQTTVKEVEDSHDQSITYSAIIDDDISQDTGDHTTVIRLEIRYEENPDIERSDRRISLNSCEKLDPNSFQNDS